MSNVICPTFGARPKPAATPPVVEHRALRIFGQAAGYTVAPIHDEDVQQGWVFKVVAGQSDGTEVEAVAILPATPKGDADAEVGGMASLRTLQLMATTGQGPEVA